MSLNGFVTLLTSTNYLPGVLVTINALKDLEASNPNSVPFQTVCLVTPLTVDVEAIRALRRNFDLVVGVEEIVSGNEAELRLLGRPDLFSTLTKLHLWRLIQFRRLIYLDADTLPLRPLSHLFLSSSIPDNVPFSACPDSGWPDCFNSGFFVFKPDEPTWRGLMRLKEERGSWDGGDQGILNEYFREGGEGGPWNRLSFGYNVTPSAYYSYAPAFRRHQDSIHLVHFIGTNKPWNLLYRHRPRDHPSSSHEQTQSTAGRDYDSLVNRWYDAYERHFGNVSTYEVARAALLPPPSRRAGGVGGVSGKRGTVDVQFPKYEPAWEGREEGWKRTEVEEVRERNLGKSSASGGAVESLVRERAMATQGKYSPPVPHGKGGRKEKRHHQAAGDGAAGVMHPPLPTRQEHEGYYVTMPLPNRPSLTHTISEPVPQPPPVPQVQLPDEEPSTPRHGPAIHFQPPTPDAPPLRPSPPLVLHHPMPSYPGSPPKLSWDPARSSPPKSKEYQMAQPFDKMYENVWDRGAEGGHGGYFEPPKYPDVPKEVRDSYRAVMGDGNGGEKEGEQKQVWKPAFPWELEARPAPSRFFPESSEDDRPYRPPPVHHHGQQGQGHPASPPLMPSQWATWSQKTAHPVPTGLPTNLSYRNAWDEVNSIRKYAELLSRPKEASRRDERMRRGSSGAEDGGESGSGREGDDEDTDEERPPIHFKKGKEKRRSTSSSPIVSPTSPTRPGFGGARKHSIGSPNISPILRANRHAADLKGIPFPSNAPGTAPHGGNGNGTGTVGGSIPEGVPYNPRLSLPVGGSPRFTSITSPSGMPAPPSISPGIKPRLHRRFGSAGASPQISPTLAAVLTPKGPLMSPTATRVFDPKTDPTVIRRQGLKALEKFVRDMEASQAARSRASSSSTLSSSLSTDGTGSSLHPPGHGGGGTGDGNEGTSPKASSGLKPTAEGRISPLSRSPVIRATE